jgi:hypothetical protein
MRLALEQQQAQQPGAAAQVADPQTRLQTGQGGEEKGVRPRREQPVVIDKAVAAGEQGFPVFQVDRPFRCDLIVL